VDAYCKLPHAEHGAQAVSAELLHAATA
jgi:hypothetical protein